MVVTVVYEICGIILLAVLALFQGEDLYKNFCSPPFMIYLAVGLL